jgi:O-antigen/teichoic acid export membrane protein
MVLTVPCSALIVGLAPLLPSVLGWPESFAQSVPLMMILALHTPLVAMDMVFGTALLALDRERLWLRVGMIALVFNLGLNLVLIPFFQQATQNGAIAAAILTSLTELLLLIGALVLLPRGLFDRETATTAVRIMLAGVAMGLVCALLQTNSPAFAVLASTIAFAGTAAALGVFRSADIRALCSFLAAKLSISFGRRTSAREVDLVNL